MQQEGEGGEAGYDEGEAEYEEDNGDQAVG